MTALPKPKYCDQNWLEMSPTIGGRICGQCDKKIVDFSKMSWLEIERLQSHHENSLCGMYAPKQLDNWGKEIPTLNTSFLKATVLTGLSLSVATSSFGQVSDTSDTIIIAGKVIDETTSELLPFTALQFKNSKVGTVTNAEGYFELVLQNLSDTPQPDTLVVSYLGYHNKQFIFSDLRELNSSENSGSVKDGKLHLSLEPNESQIISFYVRKPTLRQRVKLKFRKLFRRNKSKDN